MGFLRHSHYRYADDQLSGRVSVRGSCGVIIMLNGLGYFGDIRIFLVKIYDDCAPRRCCTVKDRAIATPETSAPFESQYDGE